MGHSETKQYPLDWGYSDCPNNSGDHPAFLGCHFKGCVPCPGCGMHIFGNMAGHERVCSGHQFDYVNASSDGPGFDERSARSVTN